MSPLTVHARDPRHSADIWGTSVYGRLVRADDDPERDRERQGILKTWLRFEHGLAATTTDAGLALSAAEQSPTVFEVEVPGRDLVTGLPRTVSVPSDVLLAAAEQPPLPW
jgi:hypothetical protein